MSADNWAICPRCVKRAREKLTACTGDVVMSYGQVPLEDFVRAQASLAPVDPEQFRTFREDYEIHGASEGAIRVDYGGGCDVCGLTLSFNDVRELPV